MYIEKLAYKNVGPLQDVRIDFFVQQQWSAKTYNSCW